MYRTWDYTYVCLVFDFSDGGTTKNIRKVLFRPRIDKFEVLEIKGLYDLFKNKKTVGLKVLSNGVYSRETYFKYNGGTAEVLNVVIKMKEGRIAEVFWKNGCPNIPKTCDFEDCAETSWTIPG